MNKITRDIKRRRLVAKLEIKKLNYKFIAFNPLTTKENQLDLKKIYYNIPRNSSKVRIRNRCIMTGRGRGVYTDFKLSRIMFRELGLMGQLPGIRKASW